jgi:hypothetical protein
MAERGGIRLTNGGDRVGKNCGIEKTPQKRWINTLKMRKKNLKKTVITSEQQEGKRKKKKRNTD